MVPSANHTELFDVGSLPANPCFLIAYSGGSDSTALLHFCAQHPALQGRIRAIHVNHQLQDEANDWQQHCARQCQDWQVPLVVARVTPDGASEDAARQARLQAFESHLKEGECLLTAHHRQDQAETVLFRLLRGTGLKGMTGIAQHHQWQQHASFRPLLNVSKTTINDYLSSHELTWCHDPSNDENHYQRNHIRNQLLPMIETRQPNAVTHLTETASRLAESLACLHQLLPDDNPLPLTAHNISAAFIHHWLEKQGHAVFTAKQLNNFIETIQQAAADKAPTLEHQQCRLIAWKQQLFLLKPPAQLESQTYAFDQQLALGAGGQVSFSKNLPITQIDVAYQLPGQKLLMAGHAHHKTIKKLHQEAQTTPWDKAATPFLFVDQKLVAHGEWVSASWDAFLKSHNAQYTWHKASQIL